MTAIALGFLFGAVGWILVFRLVRPVVKAVVPEGTRLPKSFAIMHLLALVFLLILGFVVLDEFFRLAVGPIPSREELGRAFLGSIGGLVFVLGMMRVEALVRAGAQPPRPDGSPEERDSRESD